jgi:hypothetical protein
MVVWRLADDPTMAASRLEIVVALHFGTVEQAGSNSRSRR